MTDYIPVTSDLSDREIWATSFAEKMRRKAAEEGSRRLAEAIHRYLRKRGRK